MRSCLIIFCMCYLAMSVAQESPASSDSPTPSPNSEATQTSPPPPHSQLSFDAGVFREDVSRAITQDVIPLTVGEWALSAFLRPSLTPQTRGFITFFADGSTNATQLSTYTQIAQAFQRDGFMTNVVVLPHPQHPSQTLDSLQEIYAEPIAAALAQRPSEAPISLIVAHGQIAATLLAMQANQTLASTNALIVDNVFINNLEDNRKIPELMASQSIAILDFVHRRHHTFSRKTAEERRILSGHAHRNRYRQRQLLGLGINSKTALNIHKEIKGFVKSLGWI